MITIIIIQQSLALITLCCLTMSWTISHFHRINLQLFFLSLIITCCMRMRLWMHFLKSDTSLKYDLRFANVGHTLPECCQSYMLICWWYNRTFQLCFQHFVLIPSEESGFFARLFYKVDGHTQSHYKIKENRKIKYSMGMGMNITTQNHISINNSGLFRLYIIYVSSWMHVSTSHMSFA